MYLESALQKAQGLTADGKYRDSGNTRFCKLDLSLTGTDEKIICIETHPGSDSYSRPFEAAYILHLQRDECRKQTYDRMTHLPCQIISVDRELFSGE